MPDIDRWVREGFFALDRVSVRLFATRCNSRKTSNDELRPHPLLVKVLVTKLVSEQVLVCDVDRGARLGSGH